MGKYSSVIQALITRIQGHIADGGILVGFKFAPVPLEDVEGEKDFPTLRLWLPDIAEISHPRDICDGAMTLKLTVACSSAAGMVAWTTAVEAVKDAIETDPTTGDRDFSLGGTLAKPFTASVRDCFATRMSLNAQIYISVLPNVVLRGRRRI